MPDRYAIALLAGILILIGLLLFYASFAAQSDADEHRARQQVLK